MAFYHYVEECYKDGKPRYLSDESSSHIKLISHAEYMNMSVKDVQDLLRQKHILLTDTPLCPLNFDEKGLQVLTNLDAMIEFQGSFTFFQIIFFFDKQYHHLRPVYSHSERLYSSALQRTTLAHFSKRKTP